MSLSGGQKVLSDSLIQNVIEGKADIDKLIPMFKKEPGRSIKLLRVAETQLRFFKMHPDIAEKNVEKRERIEGIVELIKEECIHKTKKVIYIRPTPEPVKPLAPSIEYIVMSDRKEPMSFEDEFAIKFKKEIDLIRQNITNPPSETEIAKTLLRSLARIPGGAEPNDSPVYRVIRYVATHKSELAKLTKKFDLCRQISEGANYNYRNVWNILTRYNIDLPAHLKPSKRKSKIEEPLPPPAPPFTIDRLYEEDHYTPPYEHPTPPKEYLTPVGRTAKPIETVIIRKPKEVSAAEPIKTIEATKTIDATDAREIVIKAQGVEIVIKLNGKEISIGTATPPKIEPEKPQEVYAHSVRFTARTRVGFCYGCGKNITEPTVALVRLRVEDEKVMPFHVSCTAPGNMVKFIKK